MPCGQRAFTDVGTKRAERKDVSGDFRTGTLEFKDFAGWNAHRFAQKKRRAEARRESASLAGTYQNEMSPKMPNSSVLVSATLSRRSSLL